MRLAIHRSKNGFHERWSARCRELGIEHARVDGLGDAVMAELRGFDAFLWRWSQVDPVELKRARTVLISARELGLTVFPSIEMCWHYDDKVAQKYLLEAGGAPLVESHVFYRRDEALAWLGEAPYPLVFKLAGGASSMNIRLCRDRGEAERLTRIAFGRGFTAHETLSRNPGGRLRALQGVDGLGSKARKLMSGLRKLAALRKHASRERGYIYFQRFLPGNEHDTRVVVIGDRAFAFRRYNRPNDFRASGGGRLDFDPEGVDPEFIRCAFAVSRRNRFLCMAYDFLRDKEGKPAICEMSYAFVGGEIPHACPGQWDENLTWHPGQRFAEDVILDAFLAELRSERSSLRD